MQARAGPPPTRRAGDRDAAREFQRERAVERTRRQLNAAFLADLSEDLARPGSPVELAKSVGARLLRYFAASRLTLADVDETTDRLTRVYDSRLHDLTGVLGSRPLSAQFTPEHVLELRTGRSLVLDAPPPSNEEGGEIRAQLAAPFVRDGRLCFVLVLQQATPRAWRADEIDLLRELAARIYLGLERARAEDARRTSEAQFRAVADLVPDLLWSADPHGGNFWCNRRWREYLGPSRGRTIEREWLSAVHPDDSDACRATLQRAFATGLPFVDEHRLRGASGEYRWFLVRAEPVADEQGRLTQWFGAATDVHEQRAVRDVLEERVRERTSELEALSAARHQLLARLVTAQEDERRRIARELHDSLGQYVTGLSLALQALERSLTDGVALDRLGRLRRICGEVDRQLDRLVFDLRPMALDDHGLASAVPDYVTTWSALSSVEAECLVANLGTDRLSPPVETTVYRIVQEALANVAKHAAAQHVSVVIQRGDDALILTIEDDGRGFQYDDARTGARALTGWGLVGIRERVTTVGGRMELESAPGQGTTLIVRIPLPRRLARQPSAPALPA